MSKQLDIHTTLNGQIFFDNNKAINKHANDHKDLITKRMREHSRGKLEEAPINPAIVGF